MEKNQSKGIFRIAVTGPESTGKSELSEQLAAHFATVWVPEFARTFLKPGMTYSAHDVEFIAQKQIENEEAALKNAHQLLICDTDMLVCKIWHEVVFNKPSALIEQLWLSHTYDFTLLLNVDLPWQPDPLREHPDRRDELFQRYLQELQRSKRPFAIISGVNNERLELAIKEIKTCLQNLENQQ
jgi:NadR type nicotinamide-nucleotide adenylyltransferase